MGGLSVGARAGDHTVWRLRIGGAVLVGLGILFVFARGV